MNRLFGYLAIVILVGGIGFSMRTARATEALPAPGASAAAREYLPADLVAAGFLRDGDRSVGALWKMLEELGVTQSAAWTSLIGAPNLQGPKFAWAGVTASAGTDALGGLAALLGSEVAVGIRPSAGSTPASGGEPKPDWILVAHARQPEIVGKMLGSVHKMTGLPDASRTRRVGETEVHVSKPDFCHAFTGEVLLLSNRFELLRDALDGGKGSRLGSTAGFRSASSQVARDAAAWVYADGAAIRRLAGLRETISPRLEEPLGGLLFGGFAHRVANADFAVASVRPTNNERGLRVEAHAISDVALPSSHRGFPSVDALPQRSSKQVGAPVEDCVAVIAVERDWADLFAEREALLHLPAAAKMVEFAATMTTLLGGLDFIEEFLPALRGPLQIVAMHRDSATTTYDAKPVLPAFAIIAPVEAPPSQGVPWVRRFESGALMLFAFLNFESTQRGDPNLLIELEPDGDARILSAAYPPPASGKREARGVRFNFEPAVACVEDFLVIASTREAAHEAVRSIRDGEFSDSAHGIDSIRLDGPLVHRLLIENRSELVANRMLEHDESRDAASAAVDAGLEWLALLRGIDARTRLGEKDAEIVLEVRVGKATKSDTRQSSYRRSSR